MTKHYYPFIFLILVSFISCNKSSSDKLLSSNAELDHLHEMMTGYFSSTEQAKQDSSFYDISLSMIPIMLKDKDFKWLYVEQAVSQNMKKPYRQRVYRLSQIDNNVFESKVYELDEPEKYIHAWEDKAILKGISKKNIVEREGCSVFLEKKGDCYKGSTHEDDCKSTLRGATHASSIVEVCNGVISSWDQGWNDEGVQVWGATEKGYIFNKK